VSIRWRESTRPGSFRAWRGRRGVSGSSHTPGVCSGPDDTPASAPSIKNPSGRGKGLTQCTNSCISSYSRGVKITIRNGRIAAAATGSRMRRKERDSNCLTARQDNGFRASGTTYPRLSPNTALTKALRPISPQAQGPCNRKCSSTTLLLPLAASRRPYRGSVPAGHDKKTALYGIPWMPHACRLRPTFLP